MLPRLFKNFSDFFSVSLLVPAFFIFLASNFLLVIFSSLAPGNSAYDLTVQAATPLTALYGREILKWWQFIFPAGLILFVARRRGRIIALAIVSFFYFLYFTFALYRLITGASLDYSFLFRDLEQLKFILPPYWPVLLLMAGVALSNTYLLHHFIRQTPAGVLRVIAPVVFSAGIIVLFLSCYLGGNEFFYFFSTAFRRDRVIAQYEKFYEEIVGRAGEERAAWPAELAKTSDQAPSYLDNIVFLHLESLNGFLVNEKVTPNFLSLARQGVYFPNFYSNGVQTILAQENILCSLPNSFHKNLSNYPAGQDVLCLPEILKPAGYRSYFFTGGNKLLTGEMNEFLDQLGFDERHNKDIMDPGDERYAWGYREDLFYKKTFAYLKNEKAPKKFIYIDVGATNHWPFNPPSPYDMLVPYPQPVDFRQKLSNTLFVQDLHLKAAWEEINRLWPEKNYTLFVFGDHSWPAGIHPGNIFNERQAFEENFLTSLALIAGREQNYLNITIPTHYSEMDMLPSVIEMFGLPVPQTSFRRSFINEIKGKTAPEVKIILVQPYGERFLSLVDGRVKYQYDGRLRRWVKFDLAGDPGETDPRVFSNNAKDNESLAIKLLEIKK